MVGVVSASHQSLLVIMLMPMLHLSSKPVIS